MAVDKVLEIDLTALTPAMLKRVDEQTEKVIGSLEEQGSKAPVSGPINSRVEELKLTEVFGRREFGNLVSAGTNPQAFVLGNVVKEIPAIGTALLATGIIAETINQINEFEAEFVDNVDDRIDIFFEKTQTVRIQAGLAQEIITSSDGSASPRDAYNTFRIFNEDQQRIENDYQINNNSGVK